MKDVDNFIKKQTDDLLKTYGEFHTRREIETFYKGIISRRGVLSILKGAMQNPKVTKKIALKKYGINEKRYSELFCK